MIKLSYDQIIKKIKEKSGLSEEEIGSRVNKKLKMLSGLISKEGAAHIVANELGIQLFQIGGKLKIRDVLPGMRSIETVGKVTRVFDLREFETKNGKGKVASFIMGDETGSLRVVLWHNQADNIRNIKEGDIIRIVGAYVKENDNGFKELHLNERSKIIINPKGEEINLPEKGVFIRKKISDIVEGDNNIEIFGTIVQLNDLRFFEVCPQCGKRLRLEGDKYVCSVHGNVEPDYSFVLNLVLDDGTETIRVVCFRDMVEKLIGKSKQDILMFKEFPEKFDILKKELLGKIIKVVGRASRNNLFDWVEFIASDVITNIDIDKEIERLKKEKEVVD